MTDWTAVRQAPGGRAAGRLGVTTLETRYRRLLRVYPAGHRADYEEEMIGVLMADAEPGRRFPAPAEVLDLLRAGLTARFGRSPQSRRGSGWRDAAAVTGLVAALVLAGIAAGRFAGGLRMVLESGERMRAHGVDGLLLLDPGLRALAWIAVSAALLAGLRRTAAGLAAAAVVVEAGAVLWWWELAPWQSLRLTWAPTVALLILAVLVAARPARPVREVVGRRGTRFLAAGIAVMIVGSLVVHAGTVRFPDPLNADVVRFWVPMALLVAAVTAARPAVRNRVAVLLTTILAVPAVFLYSWDLMRLALAVDITPGIVTSQAIVLIGTPVLFFTGGLVVLVAGERFVVRRRGHVRAYE
ncbi:hypothetical protein [Actinoplanes sp. GCM10030250]|uniref:hypothetical protein n=1 Tax=Actinoplanes sp. GCM10030250 TaxID=3273376 RepID=UPI0036067682